ncbi:DUF2336 domain-containing protein [Phreatobacter oligotrophus]|uniref:DUF2336 domain-containing protein n=1 Tax=Phreatobacter oligotrophus TaxID=1122261 RepID=UPI0023537BEE|nr:DUF2336 domain-containing protein [Phreatobacter oligotrophus]MBX9992839.1 DUF2336 domain-containing protein [Phreatobacter oligotrophus]
MTMPTEAEAPSLIHQLGRLGFEKDGERRLALLRGVADLYLSRTISPTLAEEYLFTEIVTTVMRKLNPEQRPQVTESLAPEARVPRDLALALAADEDIAVARPILAHSPVLTETDIITLAETTGDDHLQAIATRAFLSSRVTDVLIDRGSNRVLRTISTNTGAEVSAEGMTRMVARARTDEDLCLCLADRGDLPPAVIDELETMICARLSGEGSETGEGPANALKARAHALILEELRRRRANMSSTERVIAAVAAGTVSLDDALRPILDGGRLLDLAQILAHFLRFDRNFMFQQLAAGDLNTVVLAARSLELSHQTLSRALELRARKRRGPAQTITAAEYEAVDQAAAQRAMRFLKVRMTAGASGSVAA